MHEISHSFLSARTHTHFGIADLKLKCAHYTNDNENRIIDDENEMRVLSFPWILNHAHAWTSYEHLLQHFSYIYAVYIIISVHIFITHTHTKKNNFTCMISLESHTFNKVCHAHTHNEINNQVTRGKRAQCECIQKLQLTRIGVFNII